MGEENAARIVDESAARGTAMHKILEMYILDKGYLDETNVGKQAHNMAVRVIEQAFLIAAINPKSLAGYIAAFSQFVETDVPIGTQMWVIVPTALSLTTLSYTVYCALGAHLGRRALDHITNFWIQRILAACFVAYGILLGLAAR